MEGKWKAIGIVGVWIGVGIAAFAAPANIREVAAAGAGATALIVFFFD